MLRDDNEFPCCVIRISDGVCFVLFTILSPLLLVFFRFVSLTFSFLSLPPLYHHFSLYTLSSFLFLTRPSQHFSLSTLPSLIISHSRFFIAYLSLFPPYSLSLFFSLTYSQIKLITPIPGRTPKVSRDEPG